MGTVERELEKDFKGFRLQSFSVLSKFFNINGAEAEDVFSASVLSALMASKSFRGEAKVFSWFSRILCHTASDAHKTTKVHDGHSEFVKSEKSLLWRESVDRTCPELNAITKEAYSQLVTAINKLTLKQRTTINLLYIENLKPKEAAVIEGVTEQEINKRRYDAIHRLRVRFGVPEPKPVNLRHKAPRGPRPKKGPVLVEPV